MLWRLGEPPLSLPNLPHNWRFVPAAFEMRRCLKFYWLARRCSYCKGANQAIGKQLPRAKLGGTTKDLLWKTTDQEIRLVLWSSVQLPLSRPKLSLAIDIHLYGPEPQTACQSRARARVRLFGWSLNLSHAVDLALLPHARPEPRTTPKCPSTPRAWLQALSRALPQVELRPTRLCPGPFRHQPDRDRLRGLGAASSADSNQG